MPATDPAADPVPGALCPSCGDGLGLVQPDQQAPDRVLGYCDGCGLVWFVRPSGDPAPTAWVVIGAAGLAAAG